MAYTIIQTVLKDGEPFFKTGDIVEITLITEEEITGRVTAIKPSGVDYIISIDSSKEYNSKNQDVKLASIVNATVIG